MFKRRSHKRKTNKNKSLTTVSMALGTVATAPLIAVVSKHTVYAQTSQQMFISNIAPAAQKLAAENDLYASVMIAQAILETGWGQSTLSAAPNYNLFGVKGSYNGESVTMRTAENTPDGTVYYINDAFRKYPSYTESLQDYVNVLKGSSFYSGAWKSHTTNYKQATLHLTGRYATAVNYNTVLNNLIEQYHLTQYDTPNHTQVVTPILPVETQPEVSEQPTANVTPQETSSVKTYTVQSGDSIWGISNRYGITMEELREWNNLSSNLIHPGQVLKVSKVAEVVSTSLPAVEETQPEVSEQPTVNLVPQETSSVKTYTVQSGDSIWGISNRHGITMEELREWNNLSSNLIHPGQVLKVTNAAKTVVLNQVKLISETQPEIIVQPTVSVVTQESNVNKTYTVKSGDSIWLIATRHDITMDELREWNNLSSNLIHPGQVLKVSKSATQSVSNLVQTRVATPAPAVPSRLYTVKSGDSVWLIAYQHGMTMAQLRELNGLTSDLIHPNQVLRVL